MINHLSIPQYLLESSFCLVVFYIFYYFFLKKETYFQFNRFYLISSAFLSLLIPIINVDFHSASNFAGATQLYPILHQVNDIQIGIQQTIAQESNILHISMADLINWVYMAGFFFMSLKLFSGLFKLFGIINRSPKLKDQDHTLLISEDVPAASFFSYIFWKDKHDKTDPIQKTILEHEMVHVRQWHSLDVIVMEIMVIIKWFNPLIYLFRNSLKKTHEFIADKYVTDLMGDKLEYANILLGNKAPSHIPPVSNHFYGNIKERIKMLGTKESARLQQIKYFAIFPMAVILFSLFSFDLSDRLPQPLKNSFQNIETSMLAAMEKNVVSLNVDEDNKEDVYYLAWDDVMKIKLTQKYEVQDFLFYYSKEDLGKILSSDPNISLDGTSMEVFIDTIEVTTSTGKKHISVESLKSEEYRNFLIDSLDRHDQITFGLKTFSDTDSLFIKLHLGLEKQNVKWLGFSSHIDKKSLQWGSRKIDFTENYTINGRRINLDHSITEVEFSEMLKNKIKVSTESSKFIEMPSNSKISISVRRANNTRLDRLDAEKMKQASKENNDSHMIYEMVGYYQGSEYTIQEESKSYTLDEFYKMPETFLNWIATCQSGDYIRIKIDDPNGDFGGYDFNLRFRDKNDPISAPFPIEIPHFSEAYYPFQVILQDDGKSFIKMDTKKEKNQKIVEAYSGSNSYQIIHVDDFKTKYRIKEQTLPAGIMTNEIFDDSAISKLDILTINEYYSDEDQLVRLNWGKMVSMPDIGNYSINEFKRSSKDKLTLYEGKEVIPMERFDIVIIPENGKIYRIRTNNESTQSIREILSNVDKKTSIYIENIIVNVDEKLNYYPYKFVFTVE